MIIEDGRGFSEKLFKWFFDRYIHTNDGITVWQINSNNHGL